MNHAGREDEEKAGKDEKERKQDDEPADEDERDEKEENDKRYIIKESISTLLLSYLLNACPVLLGCT